MLLFRRRSGPNSAACLSLETNRDTRDFRDSQSNFEVVMSEEESRMSCAL